MGDEEIGFAGFAGFARFARFARFANGRTVDVDEPDDAGRAGHTLFCFAGVSGQSPTLATLQTRAERSGFTETSRDDDVTQRFLEELLSYAHANATRLQALVAAADKAALVGRRVSLRSRPARAPDRVEILMGEVEDEVNPYSGRVMHRRLDVKRPEPMWEEATFEAAESERVPRHYFVPAGEKTALERLRAHGIAVEVVEQAIAVPVEELRIASTETTPKPFENHQERTVSGQYVPAERQVPAGAYRVTMTQSLARLAFSLLEPRSNDSLLTWNVFEEAVKRGTYPNSPFTRLNPCFEPPWRTIAG